MHSIAILSNEGQR
uniref:Uncharacterized protein n=1 Tax=Arundo donax TaxID=35708 RepID=A0A0A9A127_ARUDO